MTEKPSLKSSYNKSHDKINVHVQSMVFISKVLLLNLEQVLIIFLKRNYPKEHIRESHWINEGSNKNRPSKDRRNNIMIYKIKSKYIPQ